jgi:hypothetical protein
MAMPNVEKDARAASRLGWVRVARNGAVVIYHNSIEGVRFRYGIFSPWSGSEA